MMQPILPTRHCAQVLQLGLARGQPVQIAISQVRSLSRFMLQPAADAFKDRPTAKWECLFGGVQNMAENATYPTVGGFGQGGAHAFDVAHEIR